MKGLIKKIIHPFYKRYHFWHHRKPRKSHYKNVHTIVQPSVFSPINTISTKVFLDFIDKLELKNKTVLELGCGSGIISIFSASKNGKVTATDINEIAIDSLSKAAMSQGLSIKTLISDLFKNIDTSNFDYIFINPPYYPRKPKNTIEKAWFCGENFEYFQELFTQLPSRLSNNTNCFMILSEDCELDSIKKIASKKNLFFDLTLKKTIRLEVNYIFKINKNSSSKQ
jgi:release factor glutamine methyltransferase